jgi:hypothetical protein
LIVLPLREELFQMTVTERLAYQFAVDVGVIGLDGRVKNAGRHDAPLVGAVEGEGLFDERQRRDVHPPRRGRLFDDEGAVGLLMGTEITVKRVVDEGGTPVDLVADGEEDLLGRYGTVLL